MQFFNYLHLQYPKSGIPHTLILLRIQWRRKHSSTPTWDVLSRRSYGMLQEDLRNSPTCVWSERTPILVRQNWELKITCLIQSINISIQKLTNVNNICHGTSIRCCYHRYCNEPHHQNKFNITTQITDE